MDRALELSALYDEEVRRMLPANADIFDSHLHLGIDIDGMVGDYDRLEELMAAYGISRAFVFCLDEPDRHPAFSAANDRTLAYGERSGGRLIPFVRLDLNESPIEEARRCLDAGARGIKLHPRAQRFDAADERLGPVFALAEERRVPAEQVVYASDFPYGQQPSSLFIALRTAIKAGLSESQLRGMLGETCSR